MCWFHKGYKNRFPSFYLKQKERKNGEKSIEDGKLLYRKMKQDAVFVVVCRPGIYHSMSHRINRVYRHQESRKSRSEHTTTLHSPLFLCFWTKCFVHFPLGCNQCGSWMIFNIYFDTNLITMLNGYRTVDFWTIDHTDCTKH